MTKKIVVVGAGGFGRETCDVIAACNEAEPGSFDLLGVIDDGPSGSNVQRLKAQGIELLGTLDGFLAQHSSEAIHFVVAISSPSIRKALAEKCDSGGLIAATLIHPRAIFGSMGSVGPGTIVCAQVSVTTNVHLGNHVQLNPGVTVGHDTVLQDFVSLYPQACISGDVVLEEGVLVGAGATVLQGLTVGAGAVVGANACVTKSVAPNVTVVGVPAGPRVRK